MPLVQLKYPILAKTCHCHYYGSQLTYSVRHMTTISASMKSEMSILLQYVVTAFIGRN